MGLPEVKTRQQIVIKKHVELYCDSSLQGFLPPLAYNMALIISCGIHAFLTRQLPENFNEAWYIFVSVTTTSFLWMGFLPTYFTTMNASYQVILIAFCLFFNASITLMCMFMPKIFAIYFVDESKIKFSPAIGTETSSINTNIQPNQIVPAT